MFQISFEAVSINEMVITENFCEGCQYNYLCVDPGQAPGKDNAKETLVD